MSLQTAMSLVHLPTEIHNVIYRSGFYFDGIHPQARFREIKYRSGLNKDRHYLDGCAKAGVVPSPFTRSENRRNRRSAQGMLALLSICRQTYRDAREIIFRSENAFLFDC